MKQFFGAFFGSIIGIVVAVVLTVVILIAVVKSSINTAFKEPETASSSKGSSVLKLVLDGQIMDRERESPFKEFGDNPPFTVEGELGLNTILKKLSAASGDEKIKGLYLVIKNLDGRGTGFATLQELRDGFKAFRKSGKFIYCYAENYSHREYYLASAADKVFLNPQGDLDWRGLSMKLLFFRKAFEKLDVDVQVFRHGRFKSFVEPFTLDKMSQDNRFQSEKYLNSIWSTMLEGVSAERKISAGELNRMANELSIRSPEDALGKLVDKTAYEDEVVALIKEKIGIKVDEKIKFNDFTKYRGKSETKLSHPKIAVIYAIGSIGGGQGSDEEIGSERLARAVREARLDEKVRAIVLRVNSPGGSALASDVIWREVLLARKTKPMVVSMGDVAASGGYYISCAAERIFAQPNTITGSIGVFGLIPNLQRMLDNKLGITTDTVNTNKYSDLGVLRPVTRREYDFIQGSVERVYDTFTKRVAEGRKMPQSAVDSIGQGRVWTGSDAIGIGLVDELGGLDKAVAYAAKKAGVKEYRIQELPRQRNPFDEIFGKKERDFETKIIGQNLGQLYFYFKQVKDILSLQGVQARLPFELVVE